MQTPLHVSILLTILALIGFIHFANGWLFPSPEGMFPGVRREGEGAIHLLAANGSRQLAIALLLILGAVSRHPDLVLCSLLIRIVCELSDIVLYGFILRQRAAMSVAIALLVWEIVAIVPLLGGFR